MGIKIELIDDLALRPFWTENRRKEECVPENMEEGKVYEFLKKGGRIYWLNGGEFWHKGELPLCITEGNEKLSSPITSIKIIGSTHFLKDSEIFTKGKYKVMEKFNPEDKRIKFENMKRIK